jgi:hypothetical protein
MEIMPDIIPNPIDISVMGEYLLLGKSGYIPEGMQLETQFPKVLSLNLHCL